MLLLDNISITYLYHNMYIIIYYIIQVAKITKWLGMHNYYLV